MSLKSGGRKEKLEELQGELEELKRCFPSTADPALTPRLQKAITLVNELLSDERESSRVSGGYVISPQPEVIPRGRRWQ